MGRRPVTYLVELDGSEFAGGEVAEGEERRLTEGNVEEMTRLVGQTRSITRCSSSRSRSRSSSRGE